MTLPLPIGIIKIVLIPVQHQNILPIVSTQYIHNVPSVDADLIRCDI